MNVFDTKLGECFLRDQVPALIEALNKLAEKPACLISPVPVTSNPKILRELFTGEYRPDELSGSTKTAAYIQQSERLKALEETLRGRISQEDWLLVEQYCDKLVERDGEELEIAFETGFSAATQMLVAGHAAQQGGVDSKV